MMVYFMYLQRKCVALCPVTVEGLQPLFTGGQQDYIYKSLLFLLLFLLSERLSAYCLLLLQLAYWDNTLT